jgi:hypothetical protein
MTAAERRNTDQTDPPALVEAIRLLRMGLWPIPITSPDDSRDWVLNPGKQPAAGKGWGLIRYTEETLRAFWASYPWDAGVGVKLGKAAGVVDLEVDDPDSGEETLSLLFDGEEIATLGWSSARGSHRLFRWDDRLARYKPVFEGDPRFPGLGLRFGSPDDVGKQFQSVCPPSLMTLEEDDTVVAGEPRRWNGVQVIADLPDVFFAHLDRILAEEAQDVPPIPLHISEATKGDPDRGPALEAYVRSAVQAELDSLASTTEGDRNNTLNEAAFAFGQFVGAGALDQSGAESALLTVARQVGLGDKESRSTIKSGMRAGKEEPRDLSHVGRAAKKAKEAKNGSTIPSEGGLISLNSLFSQPVGAEDDVPVVIRDWPSPPDDSAWHGPAGKLARAICEHTEADEIGILVQTLVGWANLARRQAFFQVNSTRHYLNLFACTTGPTALGRKGTAWDIVLSVLSPCDPEWALHSVKGGLTSGEGLIWEVRDEIWKKEAVREKGQPVRYEEVMVDGGISDKRLMAVETEFGGTLKILTREGNTLSAVIRQCWDNGILRTITKNNPARATDAHVSIVAHITEQEVSRFLSANDAANGFANRFLWVAVRQTRFHPDGAPIPAHAILEAQTHLQAAAEFASAESRRLERDAGAAALWRSVYRDLCRGKSGLLGAILGRAVPQVMRLACIYALMDFKVSVERCHLEAALALWAYCERSAAYIFGDALGDRDADHLLSVLRSSPLGLSQSQISSDVFRRHKTREEIARTLGRLLEAGRVYSETVQTAGRPSTVWHATADGAAKEAKEAK